MPDKLVMHRPTVDVKILISGVRPRVRGITDPPPQAHLITMLVLLRDSVRVSGKITAKYVCNPRQARLLGVAARQLQHNALAAGQGKRRRKICQRQLLYHCFNMAKLCALGLKEFSPCWCIEKKIRHFNRRAFGMCTRAEADLGTPF